MNVDLLKKLFVNRSDCYCIQLQTGGYAKIPEPLADNKLQEHLDGKTTIGTYQLDTQSQVKWMCFDIDPEKVADPTATAIEILAVMREKIEDEDGQANPRIYDNSIILEASRYPDQSYHIWTLFMVPVKAKIARWIAIRLLEIANLNPKQIEVFPKQNEITPERPYGNFVKLPFGKHQVEQKNSRMLNLDTFEPEPLDKLNDKIGLSFSEADLTEIEKMQTKNTVQMAFTVLANDKTLNPKDAEETIKFLCKYWKNGYRNELVLSFCGMCIKKGITHESAKTVINQVCLQTGTSDFDRAEFLQKVDYQYTNRKNIGNLKGITGIKEVIQAINQQEDITETVEVPL